MISAAELKQRVSLRTVVERHGVALRGRNGKLKGLCPFHAERTPSFSVNEHKNVWHCFGCHTGGSVIDFVMQARKLDFRAALTALAQEYHLERSADVPSASRSGGDVRAPSRQEEDWNRHLDNVQPLPGTPGEAYLTGRGLSLALAQEAGLMFHPNWQGSGPAVVYPLSDRQGELAAAEGRYLAPGRGPKVRSAGPKQAGVFATPDALEHEDLVVVEGWADALSLAECGVPAVATCGAGNLPAWLLRVCRSKCVWTAFDPDAGGEAGTARLVAAALEGSGARALCWLNMPEPGRDWNDYLHTYGRDKLTAELAAAMASDGRAAVPCRQDEANEPAQQTAVPCRQDEATDSAQQAEEPCRQSDVTEPALQAEEPCCTDEAPDSPAPVAASPASQPAAGNAAALPEPAPHVPIASFRRGMRIIAGGQLGLITAVHPPDADFPCGWCELITDRAIYGQADNRAVQVV